MQLQHVPTKKLCVGMSGMGKTLYAMREVAKFEHDYTFIFDHDGQFSQRYNFPPCREAEDIFAALKENGVVVFDPAKMFEGRFTDGATWFCRYVFQMSELLKGTKLFFCDEVQTLCGPNSITPEFAAILECGRNRALDFLGVTLYYNSIHVRIRTQVTDNVVFKTEEPRMLSCLEERGFNRHDVFSLAPGEYISRNIRAPGFDRGRIF